MVSWSYYRSDESSDCNLNGDDWYKCRKTSIVLFVVWFSG